MEENNNTKDGLLAEASPAGGATPEAQANGTVLDYLWMDESAHVPQLNAEELFIRATTGLEAQEQQASQACLESALRDYSRWLGSMGPE